MSNGINFPKDYQKDPYNIQKLIEKNIDDKNILASLKNNSYFLICGILVILKIKEYFKIASKF
jgi:hypothetical protein